MVTHADWAYRTDLRSSDLSIMIEDQSAGMDGIDGAVSCRVVDVEGIVLPSPLQPVENVVLLRN